MASSLTLGVVLWATLWVLEPNRNVGRPDKVGLLGEESEQGRNVLARFSFDLGLIFTYGQIRTRFLINQKLYSLNRATGRTRHSKTSPLAL